MRYTKTLAVIENMMERTGIRKFCVEVCKGKCCVGCMKQCGGDVERRIECSSFVCYMLKKQFNDISRFKMQTIEHHILSVVSNARNKTTYNRLYFSPYPKGIKKYMNFDDDIINLASSITPPKRKLACSI